MTAEGLESLLSAVSRLRASAEVVAHGVENRAALAALELGEARRRATSAAAVAAVGAAALLLAGVGITFVVAAIFWDTPHRVAALAWLAGIEVAIFGASVWWLRSRWMHFEFLAATREQLRKDVACLHDMLPLHEQQP